MSVTPLSPIRSEPHLSGESDQPRKPWPEVSTLGIVALLLLFDVVSDAATTSVLHVSLEIAAAVLMLGLAGRMWVSSEANRRTLERHVEELGGRLVLAHADTVRWRAEAHETLQGLGGHRAPVRSVGTHGGRAPVPVAVLLLKGLSLKEIADTRGTTERTARQQANAIYRKAGLGGRAELSAFFLEDLLPPRT